MNNLSFRENRIRSILHGELSPTDSNLLEAFNNEEDRTIFFLWAETHHETVKHSKVLSSLYDKVKEIDVDLQFDKEFPEDPIASQAFGIGRLLHKTNKYINKLFRGEKASNLDDLIVKIRSHDFSSLHHINDQDLDDIMACYEIGMINKPEMHEIKAYYDHPSQAIIVEMINHGNWEALFKIEEKKVDGKDEVSEKKEATEKSQNLSLLLLAAYCQKKISLEELATTMVYLRAYVNRQQFCEIRPLNEEELKKVKGLTGKERQAWLDLNAEVDENQRNMIVVDADAFDVYTANLIENTFFLGRQDSTPGVFKLNGQKYAMVSFGLAKAYYQRKGVVLTPLMHLSPDLKAMAARIGQRYSDFALYFPDEKALVHGSEDKTIFSAMHDLLHTHARGRRMNFQKDVMDYVKQTLDKMSGFPSFRKKISPGRGELYPKFIKKPNEGELTRYLLYSVCLELMDASYVVPSIKDDVHIFNLPEYVTEQVIRKAATRTSNDLKKMGWEEFSEPILYKKLMDACSILV